MGERPLHASHHCRHYEYVRAEKDWGPKCAAGIDLQCAGANVAPCMPEPASTAPVCAWREEHTDAERAAWKAWVDERAGRMIVILAQIPGSSRDKKNKPFWGQSGEFKCLACEGGTVRWSRARVNGHVRAACTTLNCFGVIE